MAAGVSRVELAYHRVLLARIGYVVARSLISPDVDGSVGVDSRAARRVALGNPGYQQAIRFGGEKRSWMTPA